MVKREDIKEILEAFENDIHNAMAEAMSDPVDAAEAIASDAYKSPVNNYVGRLSLLLNQQDLFRKPVK